MPAIEPDLLTELLTGAGALPADLEALRDRRVVVKFGGAAMADPATMERWARDVVLLRAGGIDVTVVHGGGPVLTRVMARLGIESTFHEGHRITDAETAEIAQMVLSGSVNKSIVSLLQLAGGRAAGLSGTDAGMLEVEPYRPGGVDLGYVGTVSRTHTELLGLLLANGYIPVVSSTATDAAGHPYNVNADLVAGALAIALDAAVVLFLSDVAGVMVDGALQTDLSAEGAAHLLDTGTAAGGMRPKLEAALAAINGGVGRAYLVDGRAPHSMIRRLIGGHPDGTTVRAHGKDPA